jgi:hypothetical protein
MSMVISISIMISVKQVQLTRWQQITSDYQLECEGMQGQSCTWDAEMGGMITTFWEPDHNIHLPSCHQIADILESVE